MLSYRCSVVKLCLTLQPHGLQQVRLPCPSSPAVCSNSCPLSWWCYLSISSSVIPYSIHLQSFLASGAFPSVSSSHQVAKVLELQLHHQSFQWIFRTDLISLQSKGLSRVLSNTTVQKQQFFGTSVLARIFFSVTLKCHINYFCFDTCTQILVLS